MAVPSSGELKLRADINLEINDNVTDTNVSLGTLSDDAGFDAPDEMSEFYGYSAFTPPTISGTTGANQVGTTSMRVFFNYDNPQGNNLKSRIWFGTNSNRTSNSVYDEGNSTATQRTPARVFSGLTSGTTYYAWGELSDTQSPARFTTLIAGQLTQATSLPVLGMSASLFHGQTAGSSWYSNACNSPCVSSSGYGGNQYSNGEITWTSNSSTPTGNINLYGYCNFSPYSSLGLGSYTSPGPNNNGSYQWGATVNISNVISPYASCGTCLSHYVRYSRSGYQTSYHNIGGLKFGP